MKKIMTKSVLLLLAVLSFSMNVDAQKKRKANKDTEQWKYEIECAGTGAQGTYLIKVWSYSKKPKIAIEQAKKNAVHGIIFKGFAGGKNGCSSQKPLARNPSVEFDKEDFFKDFFLTGGRYMKFVSSSTDGAVGAGDVTKVSKKMYKVGVVVSVQKDALRKDLEAAGIIKGLASGF